MKYSSTKSQNETSGAVNYQTKSYTGVNPRNFRDLDWNLTRKELDSFTTNITDLYNSTRGFLNKSEVAEMANIRKGTLDTVLRYAQNSLGKEVKSRKVSEYDKNSLYQLREEGKSFGNIGKQLGISASYAGKLYRTHQNSNNQVSSVEEVVQPSEIISPEGKSIVLYLPKQPAKIESNKFLSYLSSVGQSAWKKTAIAVAAAGVLVTTGIYALLGTTGCANSNETNKGEFVIRDPYHPAAGLTETRPSFKITGDLDMDPRANIIVINGVAYSPVELKQKNSETKKEAPQTKKASTNLETVVNAPTNAPVAAEKPEDYKLEKPKDVQPNNTSNTTYQAKATQKEVSVYLAQKQLAKDYAAAQPTNVVKKVAAKKAITNDIDKIIEQELKDAKIEAAKPKTATPKSKGYDPRSTKDNQSTDDVKSTSSSDESFYDGWKINIGGKSGKLGDSLTGKLFIPLIGDNDNAVFTELGGFSGDKPGFTGLVGYRHLFDDSVILGINGAYDTTHIGGGLELLSKWIDIRGNLYNPLEDAELIESSETSDYIVNKYRIPMKGFDANLSILLPFSDKVDTRLKVGYTDLKGEWGNPLKGPNLGLGITTEGGYELSAFAVLGQDKEGDKENQVYGIQFSMPLGKTPSRSGTGSRLWVPVDRIVSPVREQNFYYDNKTGAGSTEEPGNGSDDGDDDDDGENPPGPKPEPRPDIPPVQDPSGPTIPPVTPPTTQPTPPVETGPTIPPVTDPNK